MAEPGGLQLLPETRRHVEIKGQKKRGSIFLGVFLIILVTAGYIAADFYLTSLNDELAGLNNQVLDIDERRDKEMEREIAILNSQLALIGSLLTLISILAIEVQPLPERPFTVILTLSFSFTLI